jgi:alpha-L-fucosidase
MKILTLFRLLAPLAALFVAAPFICAQALSAQDARATQRLEDELAHRDNRNRPEREVWLQDAGFGLFLHFSLDSQLGITISHSLVGASEDYLQRYFHELPKTFNPDKFDARAIARLARLAGMKYVVLTAKHHSGFCLWDTATTDFTIMRTPYGRDLVKDYVEAVRAEGLAVGFYFSPEDFHFLHQQGVTITRNHREPLPDKVMTAYVDLIKRQCTELMTRYGQIDVFFIDGDPEQPVRDTVWGLQPGCLITRGAIATPEQNLPGVPLLVPWESCVTLGVAWQYQATNENHKSGARLIQLLVETRAKGGALLLNLGPRPDGSLIVEQENSIRELAAWRFVNRESVEDVRPWIVTNEGPIWFTRHKSGGALFAVIPQDPLWPRGERREFVLHSVEATPRTRISVLGQNDRVVEYQPNNNPQSRFEQRADGLHVSVVRAQRLYDNNRWPNPIVVKLENVLPALTPPVVKTGSGRVEQGQMILSGELLKLAAGDKVEVGFRWRPAAAFADKLYNNNPWREIPAGELTVAGNFTAKLTPPAPGTGYDIRAFARHPKLTVEGEITVVVSPR